MKIQHIQKEATLLRAPSVRDIVPSLVLFVISRGALLGFFPFGFALFAAAFDKSIAYLGITVMYIGLLTAGAGSSAIKYILAALLFWIYTKIIPQKLEKTQGLASSAAIILGGIIYMLQTHFSVYGFSSVAIEALVVFFMFEVFGNAQYFLKNPSSTPSQLELISCAVALGSIVVGTSDISLPYGIHPSIILAIYILLITSYTMSASLSGAMGIVTGFISGLNSEAITLAGIMGLGVMLSAMLKPFKKIGIICGFLGGISLALLYVPQGAGVPLSIFDGAIAAALFSVTPKSWILKIPELFSTSEYSPSDVEKRAIHYMKTRINGCYTAFSSLQKTFQDAAKKREETKKVHPEMLFDDVCRAVCTSCPGFTRCYDCSFDLTYDMFNVLFEKTQEKGTLNINSLPLSLRDQCMQFERLCSEFVHRYTMASQALLHLGEMRTGADLCAMQYGEIADILSRIVADVEEGFVCCTELERVCANEFHKHNILINSLSISENRFGKYEILLGADKSTDMNLCEKLISGVLMSNIGVDSVAGDGLYHMISKPVFGVDIGATQKSKEEVCGDSLCIFTADDHKLYAIISDGMGCGDAARCESDICTTLIKEFILAGFSPETAIAITNSALCLKSESETFATIDLCEIDLITGKANFYKIGSAISLLYDNGEVSSVFSVSLPAGMLPHIGIKAQGKVLFDANIILMVSDGITEAGEIKTDWLKSQLKTPHSSMQEKADAIMAEAIKKSGGEIKDDMSVICVMLKCE